MCCRVLSTAPSPLQNELSTGSRHVAMEVKQSPEAAAETLNSFIIHTLSPDDFGANHFLNVFNVK